MTIKNGCDTKPAIILIVFGIKTWSHSVRLFFFGIYGSLKLPGRFLDFIPIEMGILLTRKENDPLIHIAQYKR